MIADLSTAKLCCLRSAYSDFLGKIFELFPRKQPEHVYHYTSLPVFWEFLRDGAGFCCTFCHDLSDQTEFKTGLFKVSRIIKETHNERLMSLLRDMNSLSGDSGLDFFPWTMSFCSEGDATKMWKEYTNSQTGGCSVEFSYERISDVLASMDCVGEVDALIWFLPCLYLNEGDDGFKKLISFTLETLADRLALSIGIKLEAAQSILGYTLASIIKHDDFSYEREWRLIVHPLALDYVTNSIDLVGGKLRIRARPMDSMVRHLITKVTVSPHGPTEKLKRLISAYLAIHELTSIPVVPSNSPYQGN